MLKTGTSFAAPRSPVASPCSNPNQKSTRAWHTSPVIVLVKDEARTRGACRWLRILCRRRRNVSSLLTRKSIGFLFFLVIFPNFLCCSPKSPYPRSSVITEVNWYFSTHRQLADGS